MQDSSGKEVLSDVCEERPLNQLPVTRTLTVPAVVALDVNGPKLTIERLDRLIPTVIFIDPPRHGPL